MAKRNVSDVERKKGKGISGWGYALLSGASLLVSILLLLVFIAKIPLLSSYGVQGNIFYVLLIPLGLSVASFTFGAMKSYARFTGHILHGTIEAGGPFVAAALVVAGGFVLPPPPPPPAEFNVTAQVQDADGTPVMDGYLTIFYGNASIRQPIAANGNAHFNNIPTNHKSAKTKVRLESAKYQLADPNAQYDLSASPLMVIAGIKPGYQKGYEIGFAKGRIHRAVDSFFQSKGRYPSSLEELNGLMDISQYLNTLGDANVDYKPSTELGFILKFSGGDNVFGTGDDHVITKNSL